MSKRSKVQIGVDRKKRQKERREDIKKRDQEGYVTRMISRGTIFGVLPEFIKVPPHTFS